MSFKVEISRSADHWSGSQKKLGEGAKTVVLSLMTKWSKWKRCR